MTSSQRLSFALLLASAFLVTACDDTAAGGATSTSDRDDTEQNIETVEERIAASNAQDWGTWVSLHSPDAQRTAPELEQPLVGAVALRAGIEELFITFPDYHLELVEAFGDGDRLMARIHARGTMLGPMTIDGVEIPPTGMAFEQDWVAVLTFDDEARISAIDEFYDNYGTLLQLGLAQ